MSKKTIFSLLAASGAILFATHASADIKWDYSGTGCSAALSCGTVAGGITATATAWADTADSTGSNTGSTNGYLQDAYITTYSGGLGVTNRDAPNSIVSGGSGQDAGEGVSPEHAMDNHVRYDSLLIKFSQAINLTQVQLGWWQTDSDITVLRYTGAGAPTLAGKTYAGLLSQGWQLVGNYANVGTLPSEAQSISAGGASNYWLIGAYNPLGGSVATGFTTGDDYVKLLTLSGTSSNKVPSPAPLTLMVAATLAWLGVRKTRLAKV